MLRSPLTVPCHHHEIDVPLAGDLRDFGSWLASGDHEFEQYGRRWRTHGQHAIHEFAGPCWPFMMALINVTGRRKAPRLFRVGSLPSCDVQGDDFGTGGLGNLGRGSRGAV
jgi:hypothetical protein